MWHNQHTEQQSSINFVSNFFWGIISFQCEQYFPKFKNIHSALMSAIFKKMKKWLKQEYCSSFVTIPQYKVNKHSYITYESSLHLWAIVNLMPQWKTSSRARNLHPKPTAIRNNYTLFLFSLTEQWFGIVFIFLWFHKL